MAPIDANSLPYRPCAGAVILNEAGLIFAAQRIDNPGPAWQMPQGGIDDGETPREAVLRELGEEIGVTPEHVDIIAETADWLNYDLPPELLGRIWKGKYRGQTQKWFLMRFLGADRDIDLETEHPEFSQWAWKTHHDLIDLIVPFKRGLYRQIFTEFSDILAR